MNFHAVKIKLDSGQLLNGWCTREGHQSVIFFTHGNGFASRVYQPMHEQLALKHDLLLLDVPGHGETPAAEFVGWNQTAEYLWHGINASAEFIADRELYAVGHSLGGMLTMLAEARHPLTFKSMVLLDPIMFPQPLLFLMHIVSKFGLTSAFHPLVKSTQRRRNSWADQQQAFDYFHNRKIFKNWTDAALQSYVQYALKEKESGLRLRCDPSLEAKWFATLPEKLWPSVKNLSVPVKIFMGQDTYPFSLRAGRQAIKANPLIELAVVPGGHCFMQEYPTDAASYVLNGLQQIKAAYKEGI